MMPEYAHYTDFLKEPHFIRWQLMPDDESNSYWFAFIDRHPELNAEMEKAITYLKKRGLNRKNLSDRERTELLERITHTVTMKKGVRQSKIIRYMAVASIAVALIVVAITLFITPDDDTLSTGNKELIVGEMLHNEDIQLITNETAVTFQEDVDVTLNQVEGSAQITQQDEAVTHVKISRQKMSRLVVPYGKRSTITLSDGSRITLNSGSILEFPAIFQGKKREIRLTSGEIYIEVSPDKKRPFYVHTSDFAVKVYGTAFNLSAYEQNSSAVVLVEGSVALIGPESREEVALQPNERATFNQQTKSFSKERVDVINYISWKEGFLTLAKTPMTEVLKQVERYYNISFNYDQDVNLRNRTCTGKIYLSDNLDNVMTTIALLSSTNYKTENNKIYITHEPQ